MVKSISRSDSLRKYQYKSEHDLYIQYIYPQPTYEILLGRPFDILMESVVRNFANEEQTITIFDPPRARVTVPTARNEGCERRINDKFSSIDELITGQGDCRGNH